MIGKAVNFDDRKTVPTICLPAVRRVSYVRGSVMFVSKKFLTLNSRHFFRGYATGNFENATDSRRGYRRRYRYRIVAGFHLLNSSFRQILQLQSWHHISAFGPYLRSHVYSPHTGPAEAGDTPPMWTRVYIRFSNYRDGIVFRHSA